MGDPYPFGMSASRHCFRIRWRLEHTREFSGIDKPLTVNLLPGIGECELKLISQGTPLGSQDLALRSRPFETEKEAHAGGDKALTSLLLASLRLGFGVSIQERIPHWNGYKCRYEDDGAQ